MAFVIIILIYAVLEIIKTAMIVARVREIAPTRCKEEMLEECCDIKSQSIVLFAESEVLMLLTVAGAILLAHFLPNMIIFIHFGFIMGTIKGISAFYINLKAEKIKRDFYPPTLS